MEEAPGSRPRNKKSYRGKIIALIVFAIGVAGVAWLVHARRTGAAKKQAGAGRMNAPVPVVAGVVIQKDVPIYLDGLGTVQAFNTVGIHARVDGQIQKITFKEGQDVKAGDLLAQIDPAPFQAQLSEMEAKKGQDEAQLGNARATFDRDVDLLKQQIISQQEYDTQKAQVAQLEAAVKADQAVIENAKVQLNYTRIASPIDGRTGVRLMDAGNLVRANDTNAIVVITQLRPVSVLFTLPEQHLGTIQEQMGGGPLTVLAVDRDNRTVLAEGKLAVIDNQLDTTTGTIRLKATFPNEKLRLWPGQFVNTRLLLSVHKGAAVVPASVIQRGQEGAYAFVITNDTAQIRPVKVAQIEGGEALVESGLTPGEQVVVDGQFKLQNGSKVRTGPSEGSSPIGTRGGTNGGERGAKEQGPRSSGGKAERKGKGP